MYFHNPQNYIYETGISETKVICDDKFTERLIRAYIVSANDFFREQGIEVQPSSYWDKVFCNDIKADIHNVVYHERDVRKVKQLLSDPYNSELWYGFHAPTRSRPFPSNVSKLAEWDFDILYRLAEAVGAHRCWDPETETLPPGPDAETLVRELEDCFGVELEFPSPYPHMEGVQTSRGIVGARGIWGLYAAWHLKRLGARKVLEIGAGLGWAAYHAAAFGVKEYHIVDIPLTALASSHFLGLARGEDSVRLYGEERREAEPAQGIRYTIVPPNAFPEDQRFDVVINMDSMTEMPRETAESYIAGIKKVTNIFISINHEANPFTVAELLAKDPDVKHYTRNAFWLRRGYVEEVFEF